MSDMSGTAAVGIDTVEWEAEDAGNLTLRISGRWRRRPRGTSGKPTLILEAQGRRHRYAALPEPPSLGAAPPGTWRLSFTVPGALAPDLGRTWLQFGTVIVPLPIALPSLDELRDAPGGGSVAPDPPGRAAPGLQVVPPPHRGPGSGVDPRRPEEEPPAVGDLGERVAALERDLRHARAGRDELAASLQERDRSRRVAEQRAHAEQALRRDLARQLSANLREMERVREAMGELATAEERIRRLEGELDVARRRADEAEQLAAAARAARERAERDREEAVAQRSGGARSDGEAARLRLERGLLAHRSAAAARVPAEPVAAALVAAEPVAAALVPAEPIPPAVPVAPPGMVPASSPSPAGLAELLRRELDARGRAEAGRRARLVDAEARLAARVLIEQRTSTALSELRTELTDLRDTVTDERLRHRQATSEASAALQRANEAEDGRAAAEQRVADAEQRVADADRAAVRAESHAATLRDRAAALEAKSAAQERQAAALEAQIGELERELSGQRVLSRSAYDAIGDLRGTLEMLQARAADVRAAGAAPAPEGPVDQPPPPPGATMMVEAERLTDALSRLRQAVPPPDDAPAEPGAAAPVAPAAAPGPAADAEAPSLGQLVNRRSLEIPFRRVLRRDADAAGRLLLELLPLQGLVYRRAITYDLVLGTGRGCVCVTMPHGTPPIVVQSHPRPREEVDFRVLGEPARIARLLTAGRIRRLLRIRVARVQGRRDGLAALHALIGAPIDLASLHHAGIRLDPSSALALVAGMIEPSWTAGERFVVAHEDHETVTAYLAVNDGRAPLVTRSAPEGRIAATISCPAGELLAVLAGEPVADLTVHGDGGPLRSLRRWIAQAERD